MRSFHANLGLGSPWERRQRKERATEISGRKRRSAWRQGFPLLVLRVALFLAANWVKVTASFQKCSALEHVTQRNACYDELRNELLKPPAK